MESVREYIISVIASGLLCAFVGRLMDKKGIPGAIGKLLTGIVMMISILAPMTDISFGTMSDLKAEYEKISQDAVERGEKITSQAMRESISDGLEAYLLDKAKQMGLELEIDVLVSYDDFPLPEKVYLSGDANPYAKKRLMQIIEEELGVMEDDQLWT